MNFLPGWNHPFITNEIEIHLTHIATTEGGISLTFPASGIEAGDLLIYVSGAYQNGTDDPPSITTPTDFTQISVEFANPGGSSALRTLGAYKIASGTEESTVVNVSGTPTTDGEAAALLQFRPSNPIGSITVVDSGFSGTSGDPTAQVLGAGEEFSVHVAFYQSTGTIDPRTYTPSADAETHITPSGGDAYVKWKLFNPPSVTEAVTADMADESSVNVIYAFILLASPE